MTVLQLPTAPPPNRLDLLSGENTRAHARPGQGARQALASRAHRATTTGRGDPRAAKARHRRRTARLRQNARRRRLGAKGTRQALRKARTATHRRREWRHINGAVLGRRGRRTSSALFPAGRPAHGPTIRDERLEKRARTTATFRQTERAQHDKSTQAQSKDELRFRRCTELLKRR